MNKGIFLTIKDLEKLTGGTYWGASKYHLAVRDALGKKGKKLTIKEYCEYEKIDFDYVWKFLRA